MTETNSKIAFIKALQKAQKEFPTLGKSKHVNQGAFGYDYLPLEQMLSLIQPVLHNNGFHLSQLFGYTPTGETLVKTKLVHEKGHEEVSELPLFLPPRDLQKKNEAHVWGGSVTYQRRYSIKLILGLETDMDNNMEIEEEKPKKEKAKKEELKAPISQKSTTFVLAQDAITQCTVLNKLDSMSNSIGDRLNEGKINDAEYRKLLDLLEKKYTELTK
mgnify:CR=1 FL=1|tara:strand:- start:18 stop:665 length:648 start_codon:yes stop_codon:yes gene_type:complete